MKTKIRVKQAVINHPFELDSNRDIIIEDGIIADICDAGTGKYDNHDFIDFSNYIAAPSFIQTHVHLCQTLFRGLADNMELLDWLKKYIFPLEYFHDDKSMSASVKLGICELIKTGTTTIMDMGTIYHEDVIIDEIEKSGIRAFVGKAMMDTNDMYPKLKESTKDSLESSYKLAKEIAGTKNTKLEYVFTPRFILSCTDELLLKAYEMHKEFKSLYHTHASENRGEMEAVYKRTGKRNIEAFYEMGLLGETSCFAHCIWLDENEIDMMAKTNSKVLHCPSSNFKLSSGMADIPEYLNKNICVSLASDGAPCNNNLSQLAEMRQAAFVKKMKSQTSISAIKTFELATINGAKTLRKEKEIGSIEIGKKADILFWDLDRIWNPLIKKDIESLLSAIVYSSSPENINSVMIDGRFVVKNRENLLYDEAELFRNGRHELKKNMERAGL
jgi:5-methylthioadenosine/S-adenosylhomocysteine deaminase